MRDALAGAALVSSALVSAFATAPVAAQESGAGVWSQFQGGSEHRGVLAEGPEPPYRIRWTFPAPEDEALSGAVIVEDLAISVGEQAVYAVDLLTGELAWEIPRTGGPISTPAIAMGNRTTVLYLEGPGGADATSPAASTSASPSAASPTSSPSPADDDDDDGSVLVALDLADQTERWRAALGEESRSGVTVEADTAYVGDEDGMVYAIALADGEIRWTSDLAEGSAAEGATGATGCEAFEGGAVDVPIGVAEDRVIVVGRNVDGGAVAVGALSASTGECTWRVFPQLGSSAISAPAAAEGIVVVGSADRFVRGLAAEDGQERWSALALSLFSPFSAPASPPGTVYVADLGGGLYRLDAGDGARVWSYQFNEVILGSPVVSGDTVLLGLNDGRLVALDAASGHLVFQEGTGPGRLGGLALAPDAIVAEKGGRDAGLIAFERDPEGRLVDVPSPTELDAPTTLSRVGLAALVVIAALSVPGIFLRRRFGATLPELEGAEDDEHEDDVHDEATEETEQP
ncbi:MAG: PQQ-binding-like beta-propeller repeat protein [Actinomycetota bacterium]